MIFDASPRSELPDGLAFLSNEHKQTEDMEFDESINEFSGDGFAKVPSGDNSYNML